MNGELVQTLIDEIRGENHHTVEWNAAGTAGGVYFYRIHAGDFTMTR